jgi:hypothetical protein
MVACSLLPVMSDNARFWMNWIVTLLAAGGTISAVLYALFRDRRQAKLKLELKNPSGELTEVTPPAGLNPVPAHFYYLRVSNPRGWPIANNVQVLLLKYEEITAKGVVIKWESENPVRWRHQETWPPPRSIGASAGDLDMCSVRSGSGLRFYLHPEPNNLRGEYTGPYPYSCVLTYEAQANEGKSDLCRIQIDYDGGWSTKTDEMAKHFRIRQV